MRPRIYGDESRFRAEVKRAINSGVDLLAQGEGVRERWSAPGDLDSGMLSWGDGILRRRVETEQVSEGVDRARRAAGR